MATETPQTSGSVADETLSPVLSVEVVPDQTTGYAAIQNNLPVVRAIAIANHGETALTDLEVVVGCSPAFAAGIKIRFERLASDECRKIAPLDLQPDHG